jgi:hypothetical protein
MGHSPAPQDASGVAPAVDPSMSEEQQPTEAECFANFWAALKPHLAKALDAGWKPAADLAEVEAEQAEHAS